ncbi:unnamed protein product, partial [Amoebophrya sp. A120]
AYVRAAALLALPKAAGPAAFPSRPADLFPALRSAPAEPCGGAFRPRRACPSPLGAIWWLASAGFVCWRAGRSCLRCSITAAPSAERASCAITKLPSFLRRPRCDTTIYANRAVGGGPRFSCYLQLVELPSLGARVFRCSAEAVASSSSFFWWSPTFLHCASAILFYLGQFAAQTMLLFHFFPQIQIPGLLCPSRYKVEHQINYRSSCINLLHCSICVFSISFQEHQASGRPRLLWTF